LSKDELLFSKIDDIFYEWNNNESPGCSIGIIRNGKFLFKKNYGLRNLSKKKPITSNTIFEIASVSKQFTAACIALLHLRKEITLNDSLKELLPAVNFDQKIKVSHLVHHESGIKDYQHSLFMLNFSWDEIISLSREQLLDFINNLPDLDFTPGSQYNYSNTNYFLLGLIIEEVTRKSLEEFANQELFTPLGMKNTFFEEKYPATKNNLATGYSLRNGEYVENIPKAKILGPRGVYTTINDLFLWDQNFYSKMVGGKEFIDLVEKPSREKIMGLSTNRWNNPTQNQGYAFGLLTDFYRGMKIIRHGGDFAGYTSEILRFPDKQLTIIILTNCGNINPTPLAFRAADVVLANEFQEKSPYTWKSFRQINEKEINSLVGVYYDYENNTYFSIYTEENKLFIKSDWMKSELKAVSNEVFTTINQMNLLLVRKKEEAIIIDTEFYTAEIPRVIPLKLDTKRLREYVGIYINENFSQKLQITTEEDKLKFNLKFGEVILRPINQNTFRNGFLQLRFHRKNNEIFYVCLNSSGAKRITFKKIDA